MTRLSLGEEAVCCSTLPFQILPVLPLGSAAQPDAAARPRLRLMMSQITENLMMQLSRLQLRPPLSPLTWREPGPWHLFRPQLVRRLQPLPPCSEPKHFQQ